MRLLIPLLIWLLVSFPTSAAEPPSIDPTGLPGPLVIVGGGKLPTEARKAFFSMAGNEKTTDRAKEKAKIVVIPTACSDAADPKKTNEFLAPWKELEPLSIEILHTLDRKKADDPAFVKPLTEATAVWFSGGDPGRIVEAYRGTLVEKELKKLHARGGVIGGTSEAAALVSDLMIVGGTDGAKTGAGFGFLPGFVVEQHFLANKREKRLDSAIAANPTRVGLGIDEGTALVIRGRQAVVVGDSSVTVCVVAGAGKSAAVDVHKAGSLLDLVQLRRAAANRALKKPFPPAKPPEPMVAKGTLVIDGGGAPPEAWKKFIELSGGPDSLIVVIPTAMEGTFNRDSVDERLLKKFGAKNVKVLHTRNPKEADDPKFSEILLKANGVWFGGGRQWRFVDSYAGTLTEKRFHAVLARGGVIGGSSAGASIQSEYMPRGHPLGNTVMAAEGYEQGFGFLPGCAVDQHFFKRERTADMTGLMKQYPQYLGIGIDEGAAIVVTGRVAEVIGRSKVAFYDVRKNPAEDRDYDEVKVGEKYDLKARKKLP